MRIMVVGILIGAVVGAAAGFVGGAFLLRPAPVDKSLISRDPSTVRATGAFAHVVPADPIHYGSGGVTLFDDLVRLEADFEVGPGPKYHLYLVPQVGIDTDTRVEETMFVDLGGLTAFSGVQSYPIPAGVDVRDYGSVVVWCEQFNVLISPAELRFPR